MNIIYHSIHKTPEHKNLQNTINVDCYVGLFITKKSRVFNIFTVLLTVVHHNFLLTKVKYSLRHNESCL